MKRGDHVYVDRVLYEHHGIAVSPWQVIHYGAKSGQSMTQARICLATVQEFALGRTVRVRPHPEGFLPETTVSRAESRLGTGDYDLFGRNCEHFASWCVTGEATSDQVGRNVRLALGALSVVAEIKLDQEFHLLHREIWHSLKAEVIKGYAQTEGA